MVIYGQPGKKFRIVAPLVVYNAELAFGKIIIFGELTGYSDSLFIVF